MLGRNNKPYVSPNTPVPKFTPPKPRPTSNGIYDGKPTVPTIYGVPNGGFKYVVNITDDFNTAECYDEIIALLANATELDEIWWNIASSGGYVSSLQMLLGWKSMCYAKQVHVLHSNADSCASVFFLSPADQYIVGDGATMFIHETQVGSSGTTVNVERRVQHLVKQNEQFVRDTYKDFLTDGSDGGDDEISDVLRGIEIYLDADEIRDRLTKRQQILEQQHKESLQQTLDDEMSLDVFTDEELSEELKLIQAEIKKRKRIYVSKGTDSETKRETVKHMTKKELLGETE